eukprot:TRINITY_DN55_c0_g1_i1.p1 TRINITY_DN55_c0_g1~~TRINITY_DN55_c0_g1_i1.p1  ORF type:complete len:140 (-),score=64.82 TRINITY_DN55_c0_g1_i1:133-552(-)
MANHGPCYGLDAEIQAKLASKYDLEVERKVIDWLQGVTGETIADLHLTLKTGVYLCKFMNQLRPGICPKINTGRMPFLQMENINAYINACSLLGMKTTDLFQTVDLFEAKNMTAVLTNLYTLGMFAPNIPGFSGPYMTA